MGKQSNGTLWPIRQAMVAIILFAVGHALAQDPPKPRAVDPKLEAFDGDVVGYDGIAIDMKTTSVAYDELDFQIADWEANIKNLESLIAMRQAQGGPEAQAKIAGYNQEIAVDQAHIDALVQRKKIRDSEGSCDAKIKGWQDLIETQQRNIKTVQGLEAGAPAGDARTYFHELIERDTMLEADAVTQLGVLQEACAEEKDREPIKRFSDGLDNAGSVVKKAAAEAQAIARNGHFKDIPAITKKLAIVVEVARANQLYGNKELGLAQQQLATETLSVFAHQAVTACQNDSFENMDVLSVQLQVDKLGIDVDLSPCLNRLMQGAGGQIDQNFFFAYRRCGTSLAGEWQIRERSRSLNLTGSGEVAGAPAVSGKAQVNDDGSGTVTISGTITPPGRLADPYKAVIDGTIEFTERISKTPQGLESERLRMMKLNLTFEAHTVTYTKPRLTRTVPAHPFPGGDGMVVIINDNKPCNPAKSVWDYP